jgi:translation initiation factor 5
MALINVRRDISDNFYRYKMERLVTKVEGKGNGIKTVVVNLPSVAKSLERDPNYIIKYFAFELGAQTNTDPKDDRWIINGVHESSKLQDLLDGFIKKFVLCKKCGNPETVAHINDPRIVLDCKACGQRTDVDLRLKLSGFIIKHEGKGGKKDKSQKKALRRARKEAAQNGTANGNASGGEEGSDHGSNENGNANGNANSDDEFNKFSSAAPAVESDVEVKDDDWAVDMSEEAVRARQAQLPEEFKGKLNIDDDGEGSGRTVYDDLGEWVQSEAISKGSVDNVDSIGVYVKAKELGIEGKHRTIEVLTQTLFDKNICAQIPKRASMIKQVCIFLFCFAVSFSHLLTSVRLAPLSVTKSLFSVAPSVFSESSPRRIPTLPS